MIYSIPEMAKAPGKLHPFLASSVVEVPKGAHQPAEHSPFARWHGAQDRPARESSVDSWYLIWSICQLVISIAEDDTIKEMGAGINYFLLRIYSLRWIPAPLMNLNGRSERLVNLPRKCSHSHLKHYCIHRQRFHTGVMSALHPPSNFVCQR